MMRMGMMMVYSVVAMCTLLIVPIVSQPLSDDAHAQTRIQSIHPNLVGPEKIWVFAVTANTAPMSYVNVTTEITGFSPDLVYEVCRLVNRKCKVILMEMLECWEKREYYLPGLPTIRVERPGQGLMNGWFDACVGWAPTLTRSLSAEFSIPYAAAPTAKFWIPKTQIDVFNWLDVSWQRIAFISGVVAGPECATLNGIQGVPTDPPMMFAVPDITAGIMAVKSGRVKALFTDIDIHEDEGLTPVGSFFCADSYAIMTRKDSRLLDWWDDAFDDFKIGGGYQQFCELAPFKYVLGYNVACL